MERKNMKFLQSWILAITLLACIPCEGAETTLWQIGEFDNSTAEFAFAPKSYTAYQHPGFFIVGVSDAKRDWPYVQPGIIDGGWAPGTPQTFEVFFALTAVPREKCKLIVDFVDTHSIDPPRLRIAVNDKSWEFQTPKGNGDASVFGDPSKGREHVIEVSVPAHLLRAGNNSVTLTTVSGSWVLWDALRFEAPRGTEPSEVEARTVIRSIGTEPAIVRHEGKERQPVTLDIRHVGGPVDVQVRADNLETTVSLRPGVQSVNIHVTPATAAKTVKVIVIEQEKTLATQEIEVQPVRRWEIHLVHQTHLDIGFTHTQEDVLERQVDHLRTALRYIEETRDYPPEARFVWHPEGMWAIEEFMRTAPEAEKKVFVEACRNGRIHVDVLYAQAMTGMYSEEELFELLGAAKRFGRRHGISVVSAMQSDVPGYTWGLASALAHHDVPYMSVGPNWFASGGPSDYFKEGKIAGRTHRGGRVFHWADQPFWWVNPSGKHRVFFWMPGWGYSGFHGNRGAISKEKVFAYLRHLDNKGYPYEMVLWRYGIGADNGPPSRELPDLVKAWNEKYASPRLIITQNSKAMKTFVDRYGDQIPVLKGDYSPYWEDGSASTANATAINRRTSEKLAQVQTLWSMLDPKLSLHERVYAAWNKMIMYDEHTWGAHCSISRPDSSFSVKQDRYKQDYAFGARRLTNQLYKEVTRAVIGAASSGFVDVYNTASWPRDGLVLLSKEQSKAGDLVKDAQGRAVPSQRLDSAELAFVARDVPPLGARRYTILPGKAHISGTAKAEGRQISNALLSLEIDEQSGSIKSLRCRGIRNDLVDERKGTGLNDYLYIIGRDANKNRARIEGPAKVVVEDAGPVVATLRIESDAPGCNNLIRWIRVVDGLDYVELINRTDKRPELRPEGLYFGFPFNVPDPTVRIDVPWAVVEVEKDQVPGANRNFYCVQRWVDLSNKEYGVTWVTMDAPMLQFDPIKIAPAFGVEHWREHIDPGAHIYSWTMNNHWETNYKAYQAGRISFRYLLRPHAGGYCAVDAQRFGRSMSQPLLAVSANRSIKVQKSLVEVEGNGVVVTTIRPSRDGKAYMVRLFNVADEKQTARLTWNLPLNTTWISNPMEDKTERAPAAIEMVPFEIVTLRAEM
jgi:alpha-mannosidase